MPDDSNEEDVALLIDRFVSASTASDVSDSLQRLVDAPPADILPVLEEEPDHFFALLQVLHDGTYKHMEIQDGASLAAQVILKLLETTTSDDLLQVPSPGRLLETLIDVACDDSTTSYTRVLSCQALQRVCGFSIAQEQLLQAPNGIHRLGDLLSDADEQVQTAALLLAGVLATWSSVAKVWMFAEIGDRIVQMALDHGGLEGGNVIVLDCLQVLQKLVQHDVSLADLVVQSPTLLPNLARLLDLRTATQFVHAPTAGSTKKTTSDSDDLDDLLQAGSAKASTSTELAVVPKLTKSEEEVIQKVLNILQVVLAHDSIREQVWTQHSSLCSLVWELALISPPPPGVPFACAMPSATLQQVALEVTAEVLNHPRTLHRHAGLDRLAYLMCTGGLGESLPEKLGISQAALHVLRQTVPAEEFHAMLLNTLAPSMDESDNKTPEPTVVQKLLNTLSENLIVAEPDNKDKNAQQRRYVFLAGSLAGLELFLTDEASREVMLRLTTTSTPSLMDSILETLGSVPTSENDNDVFVPLLLLRFVCHWMVGAPNVVHAILSSPHSTSLSVLFRSSQEPISAMACLALGLAMEYLGDENECGGWTRESFMEMISNYGVSRFTARLAQFRATTAAAQLPWAACKPEFLIWSQWYDQQVLIVRKRVVQQLTTSHGGDEDDNEDGALGEGTTSNSTTKALQKLVGEQSNEIDELRAALTKAQQTVSSQEKQLSVWKKRVESTPTQLDNLLTESTSKVAELDQKIVSLEEELRITEEKHQSELKGRDDAMASLRSDLEEAKARETEAREERDSLREDMTALSEAYSNLEGEYQRSQSGQAGMSTAAPTGEQQEASREQPEGEESKQTPTGSTEVATLRAENNRLRDDARAAADWMAMAVERMNTMGADNARLQQEVSTFQQQLQVAQSAPVESADEADRLLKEERECRIQLEAELSQSAQHASQMMQQEKARRVEIEVELVRARETMQQLEDLRVRNQDLESQINNSRVDVQSALDSLGAAKSAREELERKIESLTRELENAREEIFSLREGHQEPPRKDADAESSSDVASLRASVESLQEMLTSTRTELENNSAREQQEIYKREAKIRELEARLDGGLGGYTVEDVKSRDEEISELKEANDAAQEWMTKAVEHHQVLSNQVSTLTEEKVRLTAELKDLRPRLPSPDNAQETDRMLQEIAQRDTEILELRSQASSAEQMRQELSQRNAEIEALQSEFEERKQQLRSLEASMSQKEQELTESRTELHTIRSHVADQTAEIEMLQSQVTTVEQLDLELSRRSEELDALRAECDKKQEEIELLLARAAGDDSNSLVSEQVRQLAAEKEAAQVEVKQLEAALQERDEALAVARKDLNEDVDVVRDWKDRVAELESTVQSLEGQLEEQSRDANNAISQWQESYTALEVQLEALAREKEELQSRTQDATEQRQVQQTTAEVPLESGVHSGPLEVAQNRVAELETTVQTLERQLEDQARDADDAISQWQESYTALESEVEAMSREKEELLSRLQGSEEKPEAEHTATTVTGSPEQGTSAERAEERQNRIAELESIVQSLEEQLEDQARDADDAISQWQESYTALERQLEAISEEKEEISSRDESQNRITELESNVQSLEAQLEEQSRDADGAISQWQESYTALEARNKEIESQLEMHSKEKEEQQMAPTPVENDIFAKQIEESQNRIAQLESNVQSLEAQLEEQSRDANTAISQWQESYTALEARNMEIEAQLETVFREKEELLSQKQDATQPKPTEQASAEMPSESGLATDQQDESQNRIAGLESNVQALEAQLEEQSRDASNVISQWQESYTALEARFAEAEAQLEKERVSNQERATAPTRQESPENDALAGELEQSRNRVTELESIVQSLEGQLQEHKEKSAEHDAIADQLEESQNRVTELESIIQSLEVQIQSQSGDADKAILKWQESYTALQAQLETVSKGKEVLLNREQAASEKQKTEEQYENRIYELEMTVQGLEKQLEERSRDADNITSQWQDSYSALESRNAEVEAQLELISREKEDLLRNIQSTESNSELSQGVIDSLKAEIESREQALRKQSEEAAQERDEAFAVITEWESCCKHLEEKIADLDHHLDEDTKQREDLEDALRKAEWQLVAEKTANDALLSKYHQSEAHLLDEQEHLAAEIDSLLQETAMLRDQLEGERHLASERDSMLLAAQKELRSAEWKLVSEKTANDALLSKYEENEAHLWDTSENLASERNALLEEVASLREQLEAERKAHDADHEELIASQKELEDLSTETKEVIKQWEERVNDQESAIQQLEGKLEQQRVGHTSENLASERNALLDEVASLREQLEAERKAHEVDHEELVASQKELDDFSTETNEVIKQWEERVNELESAIQQLEGELEQQRVEATDAISRWESRSMELEETIAELQRSDMSSGLGVSTTSLIRLLESELKLKHKFLARLSNEAYEAPVLGSVQSLDADSAPAYIAMLKTKLEERNNALSSLFDAIEGEKSSAKEELTSQSTEIENLKKQIAAADETLIEAIEREKSSATKELSSQSIEIENLKKQLAAADENRNDAPTQGTEELLRELEQERLARTTAEEKLSTLEQQLVEIEESFNARLEASSSEHSRIEKSLDAKRLLEREQNEQLERERDDLRNEKASLQQERNRLRLLVSELEHELHEANDAMQVHITDEVSEQATQMAVHALRQQVENMRERAESSQEAFDGERQARLAAEQEVKLLKGDLSALLGVDETEDNEGEIKRRTIEATENFHRTERAEIEALKKALSRALDELESTRAAEKEAQTRASRAGTQTSLYEQEVMTAKSELKLLTQTMDEMRQSEVTRRAALEYRITSLENDQSVLRRFHAAEIENVRNDLQQVSMERDRLFQSLRESERSRDALLRANEAAHDDKDLLAEVSRLRVEKAQLLAAASEESSRAERRLREAVAAGSSSSEADVIVERELRLAAEKALENVKLELLDLRKELAARENESEALAANRLSEMANELNELTARISSLSEENESLRVQLQDTKDDAQSKIDRLAEDCRIARTRASQLERKGRYEAEVRAEVNRLQASHNMRVSDRYTDVRDAEDERETIPVAQLYDVIQKQKQAIVEERSMYHELLEEHDDLLAVLAQHDLVRASLRSALMDAAGPQAVDAAMRTSEQQAIAQYGKFMKLDE